MYEFIIISWMLPNVPVSTVTLDIPTESKCTTVLNEHEEHFKQFKAEDDRFSYIIDCRPKKEEDDE